MIVHGAQSETGLFGGWQVKITRKFHTFSFDL